MHRKRILWIAVIVVALVATCVLFVSFPRSSTQATAPRAAAVVNVTRGSLASTLTVAGQFQAYQQVDLHAKVSGYIRSIKVDIGDRVRLAQALALLEVPKLQDQVEGAQDEVR